MLLGQPPQPRGGELERLVPADPLPARVGITLRARPFERIEQPVGVVDQLRRGSSLGAQRLAGWVRWIRLQSDETAVLDDGDRATPRGTQRAVALNPLDGGSLGGHDGTLPSTDCCASTPASSARTQGSPSLARAVSARLGIGQRQADSRTLNARAPAARADSKRNSRGRASARAVGCSALFDSTPPGTIRSSPFGRFECKRARAGSS